MIAKSNAPEKSNAPAKGNAWAKKQAPRGSASHRRCDLTYVAPKPKRYGSRRLFLPQARKVFCGRYAKITNFFHIKAIIILCKKVGDLGD